MKRLLVLTLICVGATVRADEKSHRAAAEELLVTMKIEKQLDSAISQSIDIQMKNNPVLAPHRESMKKFFDKHMSWASLKDEMIVIYKDAFTEAELKEITAFYRTPTGKKMVEKMPELTAKGMQLGVKRVQDNRAELEAAIRGKN